MRNDKLPFGCKNSFLKATSLSFGLQIIFEEKSERDLKGSLPRANRSKHGRGFAKAKKGGKKGIIKNQTKKNRHFSICGACEGGAGAPLRAE